MDHLSYVVVAGGRGRRMGSELLKQYIELQGQPILIHTLLQLKKLSPRSEFIVVVPNTDVDIVARMLEEHQLHGIQITTGGATRAESVFHGLQLTHREFVAVHDSVRPFITKGLLDRLSEALLHFDAVIPATTATDSIRVLSDQNKATIVDRNLVYLIQTPQCFRRELIMKAYELYFASPEPSLTDDASIVEFYCGTAPEIVLGDENNLKITTPKDLAIADYILNHGL